MSKFSYRLAALVFGVSFAATACGVDEPGSAQEIIAPSTTAVITTPTSTVTSVETTSTSTVPVESLAFEDGESSVTQRLWNDVGSVLVSTTFEFEADPSLELAGGFTAGQGLTVRWTDFDGDDVLVMLQGEQAFRVYRVGNEVFLDDSVEHQELVFAQLLAEALEPLETGIVEEVFTSANNGALVGPDVLYSLPPNETEGQIIVRGGPTVHVIDQESDVNYLIPEGEIMLTREQVGTFENEILKAWYVDQAG